MPNYVVESYLVDSAPALADARARARLAAESGVGIHHVRTMFLPADEVALHVFEAPSADAVHRALRNAALSYQRIVESIEAAAEPR